MRHAKKPQLWIVDNQIPIHRINSEWQLIVPILRQIWKSSKYNINLIRVENNVVGSGLNYLENAKYQVAINNKILSDIDNVIDKDIVMFTDARSAHIHEIFEYFIFKGIRPFLIGIWNDGYFNYTSGIRKAYIKKNLNYAPMEYEKSIAKTFDLNLMANPNYLGHFEAAGMFKSKFVRFPFKLLNDAYQATGFLELMSAKSDAIIYNSEEIFNAKDHYKILESELSEFEFFDISTIKTHNMLQTIPLLSKAKILISLNTANTSVTQIYHAALLGIATIIPENNYLATIGYPEELLLNRFESGHKKLFRFIRYIKEVQPKITNAIANHQGLVNKILEILAPEFDPTEFITLIETIKNKKKNVRRKQLVGREVST